jgi:hypothetical protein
MTNSDINSVLTQTSVSGIAARTSTVTTSAVDLRTYKGGFIVQQLVGVVSGTTPTLDGKIQTSADGSTGWADISGATFTQVTATDSFQKIGFVENQTLGYIRYVGTITGTTPSFTMGVVVLGAKERV